MSLFKEFYKQINYFNEKLHIWKLVIIQSSLIMNEDFEFLWKQLCDIINIVCQQKQFSVEDLFLVYQLYFLGCFASLSVHKLILSEHLGCQ